MAKQTNDYNPTGFNIACVIMDNASGDVAIPIVSADADDSTVSQFTIRNSGPTARYIEIILHNGVTGYVLTTVIVPADAGTDGTTPPFNVLGLPFVYNAMIPLKGGWSIYARAKTELDIPDELTFCVILADY